VWTDLPGSPSSGKVLVNDLDLTVRAAGLNGIPLLGNGGSINDPSLPDRRAAERRPPACPPCLTLPQGEQLVQG
jgi:hypothetical protein